MKHGKGTYAFANGDLYDNGNYYNDKRQGTGTYRHANGVRPTPP